MYAMQQSSSVMLLKYFCAYTLTRCIRGIQNSLEHMRGEKQTENFLVDLLIFITLLVQLDGGIHGPIPKEENVSEDEGEDENENKNEFIKEVCESTCECSPCVEIKSADATQVAEASQVAEAAETAVNTLKEPEAKVEVVSETVTAVASETLPEVVASEQPKIVLKAVRVADKREECCVIS
jgi:hypothetical protein